ncbi:MAG TPA: DLW-39 family protein [Mycobacteriales bacterium]|nr:DLW-39 family protein [Mycobacteriales bacterium]
MKKPAVLLVGAIAAAVVVLKRRQSRADAALWREATSDTSR